MSALGQRPEPLVIREYIDELQKQKKLTRYGLLEAFIPVYLEMIPPGQDGPVFEPVHRHDSAEVMKRKDEANLKKLWRAIDGKTFFPLVFREPLIAALDSMGKNLGLELRKRLLHNIGLLHLPIDVSGSAPAVYAEWLKEFSEANSAIVADMNDDGIINSEKTRREVYDVVEKSLAVLRAIDEAD